MVQVLYILLYIKHFQQPREAEYLLDIFRSIFYLHRSAVSIER